MSLSYLITYIIIEDTNNKQCAAAKAKTLSVKANVVKDKPTPKKVRKKLITKRNIIINSLVPMELTPLSRKKGKSFAMESQISMHLNANIGPKTTILLRKI